MDAELESIEVEAAFSGNDEFTIEDAFGWELLTKRVKHFGEVAVEGLFIATLKEDFIAVAKQEDAEAVPLRFVDPVAFRGDGVNAFGEHGEKRRVDGEVHACDGTIRPNGCGCRRSGSLLPREKGRRSIESRNER